MIEKRHAEADVSVVIPAYNYAAYLPAAIESVLSQTYSRLECVVVDDGSTDNTRDVVGNIRDVRLRYVHQPNGGLSRARNAGVRETQSQYVAFLDADDRWLATFLERTLGEFSASRNVYGAVATASFRIDHAGNRVAASPFTFGKAGELTFRDFCLRNRPLASSVVIKRDVLRECGDFDVELRSSEDRDFWLRMTARGWGFRFLDEPLAEIRRHGRNMSHAARRMRMNSGRVLKRARESGVIPANSPFWLKVFSLHYLQSARAYHGEGLLWKATGFVLLSFLLWPVFAQAADASAQPLFRVRTLARFFLDAVTGKRP